MSKKNNWNGERLETFVFNEATIEHLHRYALAMELVKDKSVLDIACGEGYGAALMAQKALHVTGVDIDTEVVDLAKQKYKLPNLHFFVGTIESIPSASAQFDLVVSFETLEHVSDHDKVLSEIKRVLKPGGLLIISTPDKTNYTDKPGTKNPYHIKELYKKELLGLLKRYFSKVDCYGQQITHSSLVSSGEDGLQYYSGDFTHIKTGIPDDPLYHIALASDMELPKLRSSIFNGNSIMQKALHAKEKMVTGTITYKLGHILLYPFKVIRSVLKK